MTQIQNSKQYDLEGRTLLFAKRVRSLIVRLPKTIANIEDGKQVIRSSGSVGANYIEAKSGTFRLVPRAERLSELRRDYQLMRDMYLTEPVNFDDILSILSELEHRINLSIPLLSL